MAVEESGRDSLRFAEGEGWELNLKSHVQLSGVVLAVTPYLDQYILASAGNSLSCLGFSSDLPNCLRRFDIVKTRFVITCITVHLNRIAVGDCRDGILFYSYQEDLHKLEQLYCDPARRLVADCVLMDLETALVTDRLGNFSALSCANLTEDSSSPERNLILGCWYHMGEIIMRICKAGVCKVLDGDILEQFLELTSTQQRSVLADQPGLGLESLNSFCLTLHTPSQGSVPVERVLRLLERVHNSLT